MSEKALSGIKNLVSMARPSASGWFGVEDENFLRGWAMDRGNPDARLKVELRIDGKVVGTAIADRPHAKLIENQEGDGHYAFSFLIPAEYRDGNIHTAEAVLVTPGYEGFALKIKSPDFKVSPGKGFPRVVLQRITADAFEGELLDAKSARSDQLDLWRDGVRIAAMTEWSQTSGGRASFRMTVPEQRPLDVLSARIAVAYPGEYETLQDATGLDALAQVRSSRTGAGEFRVSIGSALQLPNGTLLNIGIREGQGGAPVFKNVRIQDNRGVLRLEPEQEAGDPWISVALPNGAKLVENAPLLGDSARLLMNGAFRQWEGGKSPEHWVIADGVGWDRGFYNFAADIASGVSGRILVLDFAPVGETLLLSQRVNRSPSHMPDLAVAALMRASRAVDLEFRLVDGQGTRIATRRLAAGPRWKSDSLPLALEAVPAAPPLRFEVVALKSDDEEPVYVEFAGLHCGAAAAGGFDDFAAAHAAVLGENLVVNSDLQEWPNGFVFPDTKARYEAARGWSIFNRRAAVPAQAAIAIMPAGEAGPRYGLAITAPAVPEYCRIEIALRSDDMSDDWRLEFAGRFTPQLRDTWAPDKRWTQIDKIFVLRRESGRDTVVARVGRRALLTQDWETLTFDFTFDEETAEADDFEQGGETARSAAEYVLVLEFRQPFSITLHSASLRRLPMDPEIAPLQPLRLEDANIRAQADTIKGIAFWNAPTVARAAADAGTVLAPQPQRLPQRWDWTRHHLGSVEVGICVYNAIDETMACLESLVGSSTVPHTVRIINDGSDEVGRQRMAEFVADKPWMTLEDNDGNKGYTISANRAVAESTADWVILLNSDTVVSPGWIEGLLEAAAGDPQVALVGPMSNAATYQSVPELYDSAGKWAVNDLPPGWSPADVAAQVARHASRDFPEVPLLNGFCTLIRRSVFKDVGGLDAEAFPMGYGEENDMCTRVRKAGYKLVVADHVYVYHTKSASFGTARRKELAKAGDKALKEIHHDVDFGALTKRFLETPALAQLRQRIRKVYQAAASGETN